MNSSVANAIAAVEVMGGRIWLEQNEVRYRAPNRAVARIRPYLAQLREQRNQVVELLRHRDTPPMPPGVHLIAWNPKQPPVIIERWSVVTDVGLFARSTLEQLAFAMAGQSWLAGNWGIRELIDRLEQVGVKVALEVSPHRSAAGPKAQLA